MRLLMLPLMAATHLMNCWIVATQTVIYVFAASPYCSKDKLKVLSKQGFREHLQWKGYRHQKLTERERRSNHTQSKTRCHVDMFLLSRQLWPGIWFFAASASFGLLPKSDWGTYPIISYSDIKPCRKRGTVCPENKYSHLTAQQLLHIICQNDH